RELSIHWRCILSVSYTHLCNILARP
ncbi:hypothetical protein AZZ81_001409, partial [Klebsiella aerogenes]